MITLGAMACAMPLDAQAPDVTARIETQLATPTAACGDFAQAKRLVGLTRPVASTGRFCLVAGQGLVWTTVTPFPGRLHVQRGEIVEWQDGRVARRLTARDEPSIGVVTDLLLAMVGGDFAKLRRTFTIDATLDAGRWRATLVPRDAALRQVVGSIALRGDSLVRAVDVSEASGDRTELAFTGVTTGLEALRPDEARLLGARAARGAPR
ncbi:MAG: outer membrane lipoprotein carrier protein LolA [Gemmatimonadaceae bacterium]|jgi:hypothetical protein|nr:outer membrane lipoprotein carrier protein LolA [Gemmatimonadaceae bacterium]